MKPVVLLAQVKELQGYIKEIKDLDKDNLVEINKKLVKIMSEVNENLEKIWWKFFAFFISFCSKKDWTKSLFCSKSPRKGMYMYHLSHGFIMIIVKILVRFPAVNRV